MKTLRPRISTILYGCAAATLAMHAVAAEPSVLFGSDGRPWTTVSVEGLDLDNPNDVQVLYTRLQQAATAVCKRSAQAERRARHRIPLDWQQRCSETAVEDAVRGVGNVELTALHRDAPELIAERQ